MTFPSTTPSLTKNGFGSFLFITRILTDIDVDDKCCETSMLMTDMAIYVNIFDSTILQRSSKYQQHLKIVT